MATHTSILAWSPMNRRAWQATVRLAAKSRTRPSEHTQNKSILDTWFSQNCYTLVEGILAKGRDK